MLLQRENVSQELKFQFFAFLIKNLNTSNLKKIKKNIFDNVLSISSFLKPSRHHSSVDKFLTKLEYPLRAIMEHGTLESFHFFLNSFFEMILFEKLEELAPLW